MPSKPLHPCYAGGCRVLTHARFCAMHEAVYRASCDARRGSATVRGYNGPWHKVRAMKLGAQPLCEQCESHGLTVIAALVHHRDRNPRNNREMNLESLCVVCHDKEHKADRFNEKR